MHVPHIYHVYMYIFILCTSCNFGASNYCRIMTMSLAQTYNMENAFVGVIHLSHQFYYAYQYMPQAAKGSVKVPYPEKKLSQEAEIAMLYHIFSQEANALATSSLKLLKLLQKLTAGVTAHLQYCTPHSVPNHCFQYFEVRKGPSEEARSVEQGGWASLGSPRPVFLLFHLQAESFEKLSPFFITVLPPLRK